MGYAVRGGGLLLRLLVLKGVEQVFTPVLLVAVLHDGPQRLGPRHLQQSETERSQSQEVF